MKIKYFLKKLWNAYLKFNQDQKKILSMICEVKPELEKSQDNDIDTEKKDINIPN